MRKGTAGVSPRVGTGGETPPELAGADAGGTGGGVGISPRESTTDAHRWIELRHDFLAARLDPWVTREKEQLAAAKRAAALAVAVVALLVGVFCSWVGIQYHTYWAELGGQERPDDLVITRQLKTGAPFKVSTGFIRDLLLAGGVTNFGFNVPRAINDWGTIENHLHPFAKARLQLATRLDGIAAAAGDAELAKLATTVSQEALEHPDITHLAAADSKSFEYVFTMLRIGNSTAKNAAASALGRLGEQLAGERMGAVTDALLAALKDDDRFGKRAAAAALGRLGEKLPGERVGGRGHGRVAGGAPGQRFVRQTRRCRSDGKCC